MPTDATDFSAYLLKIREAKPDLVVIYRSPGNQSAAGRLRGLGHSAAYGGIPLEAEARKAEEDAMWKAGLGVSAFGMQVENFPPHFEHHPEHDHSEAMAILHATEPPLETPPDANATGTVLYANLAALAALRAIEREDRPALPEEQSALARWSGWGAVPEVFDEGKPEFAWARAAEIVTDGEQELGAAFVCCKRFGERQLPAFHGRDDGFELGQRGLETRGGRCGLRRGIGHLPVARTIARELIGMLEKRSRIPHLHGAANDACQNHAGGGAVIPERARRVDQGWLPAGWTQCSSTCTPISPTSSASPGW